MRRTENPEADLLSHVAMDVQEARVGERAKESAVGSQTSEEAAGCTVFWSSLGLPID